MICTSLQNKTFEQILAILEDPAVEMAEIRLDRCELTDDQIEELFSESDTPLIATCRIDGCPSPEEAERRLRTAIEGGTAITLRDETKGFDFVVTANLSERERKAILAGGLLATL